MSLTGESSGLCRTGSLWPTHLGSPPFPLPAPLWVFPEKPTPLRCHRTLKLFLPRIQLDAPAAPGPTHHGQLSHIRELLLEPAGKDTDTTAPVPREPVWMPWGRNSPHTGKALVTSSSWGVLTAGTRSSSGKTEKQMSSALSFLLFFSLFRKIVH